MYDAAVREGRGVFFVRTERKHEDPVDERTADAANPAVADAPDVAATVRSGPALDHPLGLSRSRDASVQ